MKRARVLSAFVVLFAAGLAGCFGGDPAGDAPDEPSAPTDPIVSEDDPVLSQPVYDGVIAERVQVASSLDGKLLDNWVFRPDTEDPVPVFINFSPYFGNLAPAAETGGDAYSLYMADYFVPRGYAVVLSSARGTGYSEGCFNMGGAIEQQDAYDVVEHFAAQDWSNGNVGAGGKSYDGTIPNGALVKAPPSLKTIFPVSGISELYKYNYKGGLPYTQGPIFNTYYYALVGVATMFGADDLPEAVTLLADDIACVTLPENQAHGVGSGATGDYTDYWVERNYSAQAPNVESNVSVFFVHGLQDWNVKPDHILPFLTDLRDQGVVVKAWLHQWVEGGTGHVYPMRADWNLTMLKWLDYWLKDVDTGILDEPLVQVQDDSGLWRHEDFWPADRTQAVRLFYDGERLTEEASFDGSYEYRDSDAPGGEEAPTEFRATSDVLVEDFRIAGEPRMHLIVSSDQPKGHVIVELYNVTADGQWNELTWGGLNLRHRAALEDPQPVVPLIFYELEFPLHPVDAVIEAGGQIGIRVAADGGGYLTAPTGADYVIMFGEDTYLELPHIGNDVALETPQPEQIGCFAC